MSSRFGNLNIISGNVFLVEHLLLLLKVPVITLIYIIIFKINVYIFT